MLGDTPGARVSELIRLADHEGLERKAWVECCDVLWPRLLGADGEQLRAGRALLRRNAQAFGQPARLNGAARLWCYPDVHPPDPAVLGLPQRVQPVAVMFPDPVPQEARRELHGHFVAICSREHHLPQPGPIFDLTHFGLKPTADTGPLLRKERSWHARP